MGTTSRLKPDPPPAEVSISGETLVHKFVIPGVVLGAGISLAIGTARDAEPMVQVWIALVSMVGLTGFLLGLLPYHVPLKQVWLGTNHFRIANFRTDLKLSYAAVEGIKQHRLIRPPFVVVKLREETTFGNRFTFVPRTSPVWSISPPEAAEVIEFRRRVEAAQEKSHDIPSSPLIHPPGRSIMADDELDGPF